MQKSPELQVNTLIFVLGDTDHMHCFLPLSTGELNDQQVNTVIH